MPWMRTTSRSRPADRGHEDPGGAPVDPAAAVLEDDPGAVDLEVVVLLGVERRDGVGVPDVDEVVDGRRGCLARVVPALEGGDHDGVVELGTSSSSITIAPSLCSRYTVSAQPTVHGAEPSARLRIVGRAATPAPRRPSAMPSHQPLRCEPRSLPRSLPAAVFWDMDGTLVDTEPYWINAEHAIVEEAGGVWNDEYAHQLVGNDLMVSAEFIRDNSPVTLEPVRDRRGAPRRVIAQVTRARAVASRRRRAAHRPAARPACRTPW